MELNEISVQQYTDSLSVRMGNQAHLLFQMANDGCPDLNEMLKVAQSIGSLASLVDQLRRPFEPEAA